MVIIKVLAMTAIFIAVLWLSFALVGVLSSLCPVSKHYGVNQPLHRYPQIYYFPKVEQRYLNAYNCNIHITIHNEPNPDPDLITNCDRNVTLCPVKERNIQSALSVATWPQFVDAFRYIGMKTNLNVFYLGGSMTAGGETYRRCRCSDLEDSRCPALPPVPPHLFNTQCNWPSHLTRWLNRTYPATSFQFHDYSIGGRSSDSSSHFIDSVHYSKANLSNPALFFLDFSVNDLYKNKSGSLETYIHTIYNNFGRRYQIHPTVVLIEQYPHGQLYNSEPSKDDYVITYRQMAERYNLTLISLREVYWTYFGPPRSRNVTHPDPSKRFYPISPLNVNVHMPLHAPWYIHLFMADVLAECIKRISMHLKSSKESHVNTIQNQLPRRLPPVATYVPPAPIPPPLVDRSSELNQVCDLSIPFILSAVPQPIDVPSNQVQWEKGWVERVSHSTPGWEINNKSDPSSRVLSFPLVGEVSRLRQSVLKVSALGSYEGMGTFALHLCGAPLFNTTTIDTLGKLPISIPFPTTITLQATDITRCEKLAENERFMSVVYAPGSDKLEVRAVHSHFCKIFSVHVCVPVYRQ